MLVSQPKYRLWIWLWPLTLISQIQDRVEILRINLLDQVILPRNSCSYFEWFIWCSRSNSYFFSNAINTSSKGIDIVISQEANLGNGSKKNDLAANLRETKELVTSMLRQY
jgi:hypothetical protein